MNEQPKIPRFLQARDICLAMNLSLSNVYALMRSDGFPAIKVSPRRYVVPEDAFNCWLDDQVQMKKACGGD